MDKPDVMRKAQVTGIRNIAVELRDSWTTAGNSQAKHAIIHSSILIALNAGMRVCPIPQVPFVYLTISYLVAES